MDNRERFFAGEVFEVPGAHGEYKTVLCEKGTYSVSQKAIKNEWNWYANIYAISIHKCTVSSLFFNELIEKDLVFEKLFFGIRKEVKMWNYEWIDLTQEVDLLIRWRFEKTLDQMSKIVSEPLAYMSGQYEYMQTERRWTWTAFVHRPSNTTEQPERLFDTIEDYKALQHEVEEYFRNKPDEDNTVPTSTV